MRVLIVSSLYNQTPPTGYGGAERFVYYFAKELISLGHVVKVLVKDGSNSDIYECYKHTNDDSLKMDFCDVYKVFNPDIIILNNNKNIDIFNFLSSIKTPTFIILHNNIREHSNWLDLINHYASSLNFIFISESQKSKTIKYLANKFPQFSFHPKLFNLGFGMPVDELFKSYRKMDKSYYLYIGAIGRYKGVLDVVNQFAENKKPLLIVGPCNNPYESDYFDQVKKVINLNSNIRYIGETKNDLHKIQIILRSKALIIATGYDPLESDCDEAFGIVMLEANSLGVPIIGYNKGNISDYVIDGVNGYKFEQIKQIDSIIDKLDLVNLSDSCIEISKKHDLKLLIEKYINLFTGYLG